MVLCLWPHIPPYQHPHPPQAETQARAHAPLCNLFSHLSRSDRSLISRHAGEDSQEKTGSLHITWKKRSTESWETVRHARYFLALNRNTLPQLGRIKADLHFSLVFWQLQGWSGTGVAGKPPTDRLESNCLKRGNILAFNYRRWHQVFKE